MKKDLIEQILSETEAGYDLVADKFSETRKFFWRDLEFIRDYTKNGDKILDFGCGNGRLLEIIGDKKFEYQGLDISQDLINKAHEIYGSDIWKFHKISGSESLPFTDNYFNVIYAIAVFHHLPSEELRKQIAQELYRVMQPGGHIIITVWNLWQKKYFINILKNWVNKIFGKSNLDWNDCYITFKNNEGQIFHRYHHAFTKRELKKVFGAAGLKIEKYGKIGGRNIILIGKKER